MSRSEYLRFLRSKRVLRSKGLINGGKPLSKKFSPMFVYVGVDKHKNKLVIK